ncbi:ABC transporter ATP-binding protein [Vogesella fluminis]|nr:ABC transporter ATP-binding protein [Vogesella fluminis]
MIELHAVCRRFGAQLAVNQVSLTVAPGELFGLIGHNGAGKSTLFKLMLGLLAPDSGDILLDGVSIRGASFRDVRRRIGYLPENVVLYDNLSASETLAFYARLKGVPLTACAPLLAEVGLADAAARRVGTYSKGMRQRLGFAQALLGSPQLLLLDEPTTGLDPEGIHDFYRIVEARRAHGCTVILSSHILAEIEQRVDRLAMLAGGKLAAIGSVAELSAGIALPVAVELVSAATHHDTLAASLAAAGFACQTKPHGLSLAIARHDKGRLLAALAPLAATLADVRFIEPTLEAVFLGHRHASIHDTGASA